jgi:hypothetical protein
MIRVFIATLLTFTIIPVAGFASPSKVPAMYDKVYVPQGFDSNDHIQIVGEGVFRNSCYRPADTEVRIDRPEGRIFVGPAAYEYNGFCLQVLLPFDRVIEVGILPAGDWEVVQSSDNSSLGKLHVKRATTESPDDYLYAPISQAFFRQKGQVSEIFVTGEFSNSCFKLDDVKVSVQKDVIVVQPIASLDNLQSCATGKFAFSKIIQVDLIPPGRYLLHVRSMNSKAINTLVDVK